MPEQRASANDTGMTAEQIMSDAQTDVFYLHGLLLGVDLIRCGTNGTPGEEQSAIDSLINAAVKLSEKLGRDLDSINIGKAAS
ncbi:hypothetical protein [Tropicimonas sp. IMCC6043]|uniref:hypothetical protein n=1 Tax=Tropicimonas sp. IMCC6043 TaxID=2510645 RepID=UPI00101DC02E|nr:hypothetical protein [Tropicimonas sp. IMCC6043]RYH12410.1 hypothetical protein EU800_02310 [Tropicimonas sp. IMCC6043]